MRHNIYAHTAEGCNYPAFVSLNLEEDKSFSLTVRAAAKDDGSCGETVTVKLTFKELYQMARALFGYACTGNA